MYHQAAWQHASGAVAGQARRAWRRPHLMVRFSASVSPSTNGCFTPSAEAVCVWVSICGRGTNQPIESAARACWPLRGGSGGRWCPAACLCLCPCTGLPCGLPARSAGSWLCALLPMPGRETLPAAVRGTPGLPWTAAAWWCSPDKSLGNVQGESLLTPVASGQVHSSCCSIYLAVHSW